MAFDGEVLLIGGESGVFQIRLSPYDGDESKFDLIHLRFAEYSRIRQIVIGGSGRWSAGELNGSGGINTYLYDDCVLVGIVPGTDASEVQFSSDGRYAAIESYNSLVVFYFEARKVITNKSIGEMFRDSFELVRCGQAKFARMWSRIEGTDTDRLLGWWDPIASKAIKGPPNIANSDNLIRIGSGFRTLKVGNELFDANEQFLVSRLEDRSAYKVRETSTDRELGLIKSPDYPVAPQAFQLVGPSGLAAMYSEGVIELYDLRTMKRTLRVFVGRPKEDSILIVTESGRSFGTIDGLAAGIPKTVPDPKSVKQALFDTCGIKSP